MKYKMWIYILLIPVTLFNVYLYTTIDTYVFKISIYGITLFFLLLGCTYLTINYKKTLTNVEINEERYKIALSHLSTILFDNILDADITNDNLIGSNYENLTTALGISKNSSFFDTVNAISENLTHPDYSDAYRYFFSKENIINNFNNGVKYIELECIERSDGVNYKWINIHVCIYKSIVNETIRIISYVKDIDKQKKVILELMEKSQLDVLTGVLNKHSIKENVTDLLKVTKNCIHIGMMIDMDDFKNINDTYGHAFGDIVISQTARKLKEQFRESDLIGRIGGDEFFIFMDGVSNISYALSKAEQVCNSFNNFIIKHNDISCQVSISIGVCQRSSPSGFAELYHGADLALYKAKRSSKNCFYFNDGVEEIKGVVE